MEAADIRTDATKAKGSATEVAVIALLGTSIEWYDFFIYGTAAALVFPTLFFPENLPPLVGLMAAFSTFAVGFIARPLGGILFGHFGDRMGRKKTLVIALIMMGVATTFIGLLPPYATLGVLAPLALIVLRFVQGLAIGGQWGGAMLLVTEMAPMRKRGYYGSFAQAGAPVGVILANLIFLFVSVNLPQDDFMAWGWRVPFIISIVMIPLALYVQLRLEETPAFRQLQELKVQREGNLLREKSAESGLSIAQVKAQLDAEHHPSPVLEALKAYPKEIALAAGAFLAVQVTFYILIAFIVAYGASPGGLNLSRDMMLAAVLVGAVFMLVAIFVFRRGFRQIWQEGNFSRRSGVAGSLGVLYFSFS